MKSKAVPAVLSIIATWAVLAAACQGGSTPGNATVEVASGWTPNASVTGSVTYRERLPLSPEATLIVELRDVSYADASGMLIARQTIPNPGQVPITFKVEYNRDDIDPRNTYAISARIVESDGRLAFTDDTAYDVITGGNPRKVDMLLVLVEPPPDLIESGEDWRTWVEVPAPIIRANLIPNEPEPLLRIAYDQSTIENCARPGNQELKLDGYDIIAEVTLMQPPSTAWAIPCGEEVVELDTVLAIGDAAALEPGETYRVIVNERETTTFTVPETHLEYTFIAESPIESVEVMSIDGDGESGQAQYQLRVVSGMPRGSGCSQFNGYEIQRREPNSIEVTITHHQVADQDVVCTADYPIIETFVPLGSEFEPGVEYAVSVNSGDAQRFVAQ